eukprot:6985806-Lingulodinium_polyedra.AAC.1
MPPHCASSAAFSRKGVARLRTQRCHALPKLVAMTIWRSWSAVEAEVPGLPKRAASPPRQLRGSANSMAVFT